ncbi:MAG: hypothetical protein HN348_35295, partial [Proteobacteria bacterium]|nr:hypothetical protein [Pseudomonadota bacterium]
MFWVLLTALALAKPPVVPVDAALSVAVEGDVGCRFLHAKKEVLPVDPFMKLRVGDQVELPEGTQLALVFFNGRRETWTGPAVFEIDVEGSLVKKGGPPVVEDMGDRVGRGMESLGI